MQKEDIIKFIELGLKIVYEEKNGQAFWLAITWEEISWGEKENGEYLEYQEFHVCKQCIYDLKHEKESEHGNDIIKLFDDSLALSNDDIGLRLLSYTSISKIEFI